MSIHFHAWHRSPDGVRWECEDCPTIAYCENPPSSVCPEPSEPCWDCGGPIACAGFYGRDRQFHAFTECVECLTYDLKPDPPAPVIVAPRRAYAAGARHVSDLLTSCSVLSGLALAFYWMVN